MNEHRQAELAAGLPNRIPARVVDLEERTVGVAIAESELFEDLEPARAVLLRFGQLHGDAPTKIGAQAVPGRRVVGLAVPLPVDIGKNHPAVGILGVQERFIDVSVLTEGNLAFYSLYGITADDDFGSVCIKILTSVLPQYLPSLDLALLYGEGLRKDLLDTLSHAVTVDTMRFNAFRGLLSTTSLGISDIALCNKAAHVFPPAIGASLKPLQEKEIVYL